MLTTSDVVQQLAELGRELDAAVRTLREAELDAVQKRHIADVVESRVFVDAEGSAELRKHLARLGAAKVEDEALIAESVVRYLRTKIRAIELRVEIGRSMGASLRSERSS
ncbi:MAG TPA: hypothetical protein VNI34_07425 [Candidatus Nitrosotalea sp.]|nr:hypothetical protein [Candidatus Nitrosotalea sp.]